MIPAAIFLTGFAAFMVAVWRLWNRISGSVAQTQAAAMSEGERVQMFIENRANYINDRISSQNNFDAKLGKVDDDIIQCQNDIAGETNPTKLESKSRRLQELLRRRAERMGTLPIS